MKRLLFAIALIAPATPAMADEYVHGYYRHNGTYVQPHYQTPPDNNIYNNYSTQGNVNPYTGQAGTVNPNTYQQQQYQQQQIPRPTYPNGSYYR